MAKTDEYWDDYNNLQRVKHELIRTYLNGWLPKLTLGDFGSNRVVYFDTHAGRGKHKSGELGSPLIALQTVLNHSFFPRLNAEVLFYFIEQDKENVEVLQREIGALKRVPDNVKIEVDEGNCFDILEGICASLRRDRKELAPSFVFCDPFGFEVPFSVLRDVMQFRKVELFVNVMWRELDMALAHGRKGTQSWVDKLDRIFGGDEWRAIDADKSEARAEQCVAILREAVGARWATYIRMVDRGRTRYFLLHLTNHDKGREYMKECMWAACPEEGYYARITDNPKQQYLIKPKPDLSLLEDWLIQKLLAEPRRWQSLMEDLREEIWVQKHLNEVIKEARRNGTIRGSDFEGVFSQKRNPLLSLE